MSEQDAVELAQQELALARMGDEMDMANWVIDYADALIQALEASQQENERLRHGITAIIEGDKGDEPLETANQVVSLLEGLLAALEEQEAQ